MSLVDVERLRQIAEVEFVDIVVEAVIPDINELRIILTDGSFVDVWFSLKLQGRYSFHSVAVHGWSRAETSASSGTWIGDHGAQAWSPPSP
jgi:hypothetical protein